MPISPFVMPQPPPHPVIVLLCATDLVVTRCIDPLLVHQDLHPSQSLDESLQSSTWFHPYCPEATPHPFYGNPPCSPYSHLTQSLPLCSSPLQAHSICPSSPHAPTPYPDILSASSTPLSSPASSPRLLVEDISPVPLTNNNLIPCHTVTKIKIKRPKGAGWKNLMELVNWKVDLLDAVKVRLPVHKASHYFTLFNRLMPRLLFCNIWTHH